MGTNSDEKTGKVVQLGIFPGWKSPAPQLGEEKPRLDVVITIKVKDNKTGEKFAREIHQDFFDDKNIFDSILFAVDHTRTRSEVERFVKGRNGFPESVKEDSGDGESSGAGRSQEELGETGASGKGSDFKC